MLLVVILTVLASPLPAQPTPTASLTLPHSSPSLLSISPHDTLTVTLNSASPFLYLQISSCHIPTMHLTRNTTQISPTQVLSPYSYIFPINDTAVLEIATPHIEDMVNIRVMALESEREMPKNGWKVTTEVTDQYLKLSWRALHVGEKEVEAKYSVWFSGLERDIECRMISGEVADSQMGVVYLDYKSTQPHTLQLQIPVNSIYPQTSTYSSINKSQIVSLINKNQNFAINIMAEMLAPYELTFFYNPAIVEHRISLMDLEGGLMILLVGIVVFALVSVVYLYCKRKFKYQEEFVQEEVGEGNRNGNGGGEEAGGMKGTEDKMN